MKRKFIIPIFLIFVVAMLLSILGNNGNQKSITVKSIGKNDLFVGAKDSNINGRTESHITDDTDFAWDNIGAGKDYYVNGQYEQAAKAFRQAYSAKFGSKAVAGLNLARSYEKLGRYDEGIVLLDQMIKNGELSEKGIQNANEIKSRLLAASATKASADPSSSGKKGLDE